MFAVLIATTIILIFCAEVLKKRHISIILAAILTITGSALNFIGNDIDFVRKNASWLCSKEEKIGINRIVRSTTAYGNPSYQRKSLWGGHEYLGYTEPGFDFVKKIIQKTYYKNLSKYILLFYTRQILHIDDPDDPRKTIRPIWLIPLTEETKNLNIENEADFQTLSGFRRHVSDQNWFTEALDDYLKTRVQAWGTLYIVVVVLFNLYLSLKQKGEYGKENVKMDEKRLKRIIGVVFIIVASIITLTSILSFKQANQELHRLLLCIAFFNYGIGVRAAFYTVIFKDVSDMSPHAKSVIRSYLYYLIMGLIVTSFIYLVFYDTIKAMESTLFYCLSFLLLFSIGLTAQSMEKFILTTK